MRESDDARRSKLLVAALLAHVAASLFHFTHNAEFLGAYPNLPPWLSRSSVYFAWLGMTSIGALGYLLLRLPRTATGLGVLFVYGVLGLGGLDHYAVAPPSAHTLTMNLTIGLETGTALTLLSVVVMTSVRALQLRARRVGSNRQSPAARHI